MPWRATLSLRVTAMATSTPPRAILLNGPPRCGKDAFGRMLHDELQRRGASVSLESFKDALIDSTCRRFHVTRDRFMSDYETAKEVPVGWLRTRPGGPPLSRRQALIFHSEREMKPRLGQHIFGKLWCDARAEAAPPGHIFVFTDCGFVVEPMALLARGLVPTLVHVRRPGTDFTNDSRAYVAPPATVPLLTVDNSGSLDDLRAAANDLLRHWQ